MAIKLKNTAKAFAVGATASVLLGGSDPAAAVDITIDYTYDTNNFFANADAMARLEEAATFFSDLLVDDLDAIIPSGSNTWTATFFNPQTGAVENVNNLAIAADQIIVYAGARDLGSTTLGQGGPGGLGASGSGSWNSTATTRGEGTTQGISADDFGPWGGSVAFNNTKTWSFSASEPVGSVNDFYSVALHEIGHLLGLGTADSWDNLVSGGQFTGAFSVAEFGGNIDLNGAETHWAADTMSTVYGGGAAQEAAMDPNVTIGTRKLFTDLDVAALRDIGWEVVPEPGSFALLSVAGLLLARRRRA